MKYEAILNTGMFLFHPGGVFKTKKAAREYALSIIGDAKPRARIIIREVK